MTTLAAPAITSTPKTQKPIAIISLAALALIFGVIFSSVYGHDFGQQSGLSNVAGDQLGAREASRVVPCIMPRAWQRGCDMR